MSIERKVKPSTRMKIAMKAKRRQIYIAILVCMGVIIACLSGYLIWDETAANGGLSEDIVTTRTMLSQKVSYQGSWVTESEGLFEVYLPGSLDTSKEWESMAVSTVYDDEYDGGMKRVFGVVHSDEKLEITDAALDPMTVLNAVSSQITNDVAAACKGGRPSIAYDVETVELENGTSAVKISGNMELTLIYQKSKDDTETFEDTMVYPVIAYVTLQKGYPVGVWCTYDPFDYWCEDEVPKQIDEMLTTIWQTKFTGEDVEWVEVPTTVDEDRHIIFPETDTSEDDDTVTVTGEPNLGEPVSGSASKHNEEDSTSVEDFNPEADITEDASVEDSGDN